MYTMNTAGNTNLQVIKKSATTIATGAKKNTDSVVNHLTFV